MDSKFGAHRKVEVNNRFSYSISSFNRHDNNKRRWSDGAGLNTRNENNSNKFTKPGELSTSRARPPRLPANMVESKKQSSLPPEVMQAQQLLIAISDYTAMSGTTEIINNIEPLSGALIQGGDLVTFASGISDVFVQCFTELSVQIPALSTLLSHIGRSDRAFAELVLEKLSVTAGTAMAADDVASAKLNLRAIACLAASGLLRVVGEASLCSLLSALIRTVQAQWARCEANSPCMTAQGRAAAFLLASTLPWCAGALFASGEEGIVVLRQALEECLRVRTQYRSPYDLGGAHAVFHSNLCNLADGVSAPAESSCWDALWASASAAVQVAELVLSGAPFDPPACMPMPWLSIDMDKAPVSEEVEMSGEGEGVENAVVGKPVHSPLLFSSVSMAALEEAVVGLGSGASTTNRRHQSQDVLQSTLSQSSVWLGLRYQLFDQESAPAAEALLSRPLERHFISELCCDVLRVFEPIVLDDGTLQGSIELMCRHLQALSKLLPEGVAGLEFVFVEVLLLHLIQLPARRPPLVVRVLLELCRVVPGMPPALAVGVTLLFQLSPALDLASLREISRWHSSHLINSELAWPYWDYLASEFAEADVGDGRRYYLGLLVDGLFRATYPGKVKAVIPAGLHVLEAQAWKPRCVLFDSSAVAVVGEGEGEGDPASAASASAGMRALAAELRARVEKRLSPDDLQEWLEGVHEGVAEDQQAVGWRACLLLQALLVVGTKLWALSALSSLMDRYAELLRTLNGSSSGAAVVTAGEDGDADTAQAQKALLECCVESLSQDLGTLWLVLDLLLRRSVVLPSAVASWTREHLLRSCLCTDVWTWALVELPAKRALDGVFGSLSHCKQVLEAKATAGEDEPMLVIGDSAAALGGGGGGDADAVVDMEADTGAEERRGKAVGDVTDAEDEALQSGEARAMVERMLAEGLLVYRVLVDGLLTALTSRYQELLESRGGAVIGGDPSADLSLDPWMGSALSCLRHVLRLFHGAEQAIAKAFGELVGGSLLAYDEALQRVETEFAAGALPESVVKSVRAFGGSYCS